MRFAVVAALVVAVLVIFAMPAAGANDTDGIHISEVDVTPENPSAGETVSVTVTVRNDGETRFDVSQVRLMGVEDAPSATNLGTLAPDEEIDVTLSTVFESEGVKEFRARASGTATGVGVVHQPVTVNVGGEDAHIDVSVEDAVTDTWVPVDVDISNGADSEIRNLRIEAEGVTTRDDGEFVASVSPNSTETAELHIMSSSGTRNVEFTVTYTNSNGNTVTARTSETVEFFDGSNDVDLRATSSEDGIKATVLNLGDAAVQDVEVRGGSGVEPVEIDEVRGGSSETVGINVTGVGSPTDIDLTASYVLGDETRTIETTVGYTPPSYVRLTGTSVTGAGTVTLTGSASNVGTVDAEGVVVEVADTDGVEPAQPQSDYFVGTVPASDFGTFELNAQVTGDADAVPVEVSYTTEGERYSRVVEVAYDGAGASPDRFEGEGATGGGFEDVEDRTPDEGGVPTYVFVLLASAVVGVMLYGWRRRDGG